MLSHVCFWGALSFASLWPSGKLDPQWVQQKRVMAPAAAYSCMKTVTRRGAASDPPVIRDEARLMCCCLESRHGCNSDTTETIGANYFL